MLAFVRRYVSHVRGERFQPSLRGMDDPGFQYYHLPFLPHLLQALTALADSRKAH